jgi:hypothetical protein
MPVMNGLEAAPLLRRVCQPRCLIVYTLHDNKAVQREAFSLGKTGQAGRSSRCRFSTTDSSRCARGGMVRQSSRSVVTPLLRLVLKYSIV